ncbi:hypothetical protein EST38_g10594 [Candolleomyces aberdarensis]|uniref:Uncharacterized protein n=1 Tax=Candolleomyces aberdarensis TaxID=2316362 RepID=A0A4Q2D981_9AGAR|nr:hypothetical protein EST38_g10594 [Candolleomyces aberdarensis]
MSAASRGKGWANDEQIQYLKKQMPAYQMCIKNRKYTKFWEKLKIDWQIHFPMIEEIFPGRKFEDLSEGERSQLSEEWDFRQTAVKKACKEEGTSAKDRLSVWTRVVQELWAEATEEQKAAVEAAVEEEANLPEDRQKTIDAVPSILSATLGPLAEKTKFAFFVTFVGPIPNLDGQIKYQTCQFGEPEGSPLFGETSPSAERAYSEQIGQYYNRWIFASVNEEDEDDSSSETESETEPSDVDDSEPSDGPSGVPAAGSEDVADESQSSKKPSKTGQDVTKSGSKHKAAGSRKSSATSKSSESGSKDVSVGSKKPQGTKEKDVGSKKAKAAKEGGAGSKKTDSGKEKTEKGAGSKKTDSGKEGDAGSKKKDSNDGKEVDAGSEMDEGKETDAGSPMDEGREADAGSKKTGASKGAGAASKKTKERPRPRPKPKQKGSDKDRTLTDGNRGDLDEGGSKPNNGAGPTDGGLDPDPVTGPGTFDSGAGGADVGGANPGATSNVLGGANGGAGMNGTTMNGAMSSATGPVVGATMNGGMMSGGMMHAGMMNGGMTNGQNAFLKGQ